MPLEIQVQALGATCRSADISGWRGEPVKVDIENRLRTNRDLQAEVAAGRFRQDVLPAERR